MKRNMDLIRIILSKLEENETFAVEEIAPIDGFSDRQVALHCLLSYEAELIDGIMSEEIDAEIPPIINMRLTWAGYEFLELSRDPEKWDKAKGIMKKIGSWSFDVLKSVLTETAVNATIKLI